VNGSLFLFSNLLQTVQTSLSEGYIPSLKMSSAPSGEKGASGFLFALGSLEHIRLSRSEAQ
jgi:hypothetical protein